jgi:hypothetical protein
MADLPTSALLAAALAAADAAHDDYERGMLRGVVDQQWPGFYAAFVLGRLGDFAPPSRLAALLAEVEAEADWAAAAADHVLIKLKS